MTIETMIKTEGESIYASQVKKGLLNIIRVSSSNFSPPLKPTSAKQEDVQSSSSSVKTETKPHGPMIPTLKLPRFTTAKNELEKLFTAFKPSKVSTSHCAPVSGIKLC